MPKFEKADNPRNKVIKIRVTEAEKRQIADASEASALSVSEFGRCRFLGIAIRSKSDIKAVGELRRAVGLLKHLHNERLDNGISLLSLETASLETIKILINVANTLLGEGVDDH